MSKNVSPPRAWAEISLSGLRENLRIARKYFSGDIMAVVKAAAYGHGLERVAALYEAAGVAFLGVANVGEARRIADAGVKTPLYLLGATWAEERQEIVERGWVPCISTLDEARHWEELARSAGKQVTVHIAIDTGMGRGGFLPSDLPMAMEELQVLEHVVIDGLGSHLPAADEDEAFTRLQIACFERVVAELGGAERFRWRHLLNSAGILAFASEVCNLARPGLMLYGVSPIAEFQQDLVPVMSLKSRITLIRELPVGHGVSYGRTFVTTRPTRVATIGIGYGDGYPRSVSGNGGQVWIKGRRWPILGRITMDQMMVDVTDAPDLGVGDEVEVFGREIPVAEVAAKAGMIVWEVFTGIAPRVERRYLEG